jgi:hypothetical protein
MKMQQENDPTLTPELMRTQLKVMADLDLSAQAEEMFGLFAGLISMMNMLQPEGYSETFPAFTFKPIKE